MSNGWSDLISKLFDTVARYVPGAADQRALRRVTGTFSTPNNSDRVARDFVCSGTATNFSPRISLWLAVSVDGLFWPKARLAVAQDGTWSVPIHEGGTSAHFAVVLIAVTAASDAAFHTWLADCQRSGSFPGVFLPSRSRQLASVTLTLLRK